MDSISNQFRAFSNPAALMEQFTQNAERAQSRLPADQVARVADSVMTPSSLRVGDGQDSFASVLKGMVHEVNSRQAAAAQATEATLAGNGVPLHQTMLAIEEANVAFQFMVETRNKLLESYQELMRMQV